MADARSKILLVLSVCAVVLLVYSVVVTSVVWIEPTSLGLVSVLPFSYWIGLGLVGVLWYAGRESRFFLSFSFILTLLYLYVAPTIIRGPVWISNSYYPFGESKLVNETGHVNYRPGTTLVSYLDWPGFLYLASEFTLVTGLPDTILLKFFPIFVVALYGLLLILILRIRTGSSLAIIGGGLLLGGFFIRQQYFGPQAIAYVLFLLGVLIVSWLFFDDRFHKRTLAGLFMFVFVATTFMHPLTSLMLLVTVISLYVAQRIFFKKPTGPVLILCFFSIVTWLAYQMYFAPGFFNLMVQHLYSLASGSSAPNLVSQSSRIVGSRAMELNFLSSYAIVGLFAVVGIAAIAMILRRTWKKRIALTNEQQYSIFTVILLVLLAIFAFTGEYGTTEAYQRAFFFGLVPLSFLCILLLKNKTRLLSLLLVVIIFLNIPAQYGGDTYRLATEHQLQGVKFLTYHTPENFTIIGRLTLYIRYFDPLKNYVVPEVGLDYPFTSLPNASSVDQAVNTLLGKVDYVMRSDLEDNFYIFSLGFNPLESINFDAKCNRICDNGQFVLYKPTNST